MSCRAQLNVVIIAKLIRKLAWEFE